MPDDGVIEEDFSVCGYVPYPGSGAYGHWSCQRRRLHLGRHRFNNYTIGRIPRVWAVKNLVRYYRARRRMARTCGPSDTKLSTLRYSAILRQAKYQPIDYQRSPEAV